MNYCQELPNVELIAWKTACILVERVEKHNFFKNTRRLIVVLVVLVFVNENLYSITL